MAAKYIMSDLETKYAQFVAPQYSVKVNGSELDLSFCKNSITVELTAGYESSYCKFEIKNAFISGTASISISSKLSSIKLGNKVEVFVGYITGGMISVFNGYIDSVNVDYVKEDGITLEVECLDGKGIMMNSLKSEAKTSLKKYSEAVEKTLKLYSGLMKIDMTNFDKSDSEVSGLIEQHDESDYSFVVRLAKKMNYAFYILNGSVIFKPMSKLKKDVLIDFDINKYMLDFYVKSTLRNQVSSVKVRGNNEKDPTKPFEATVSSYNSLADSSNIKSKAASVITSDVSRTLYDFSVDSAQKAKERAQAELNALSYYLVSAKATTMGVPEVVPGRIAEVIGFGKGVDRKYYIRKVIHKIKDDKFTTTCEMEMNKV